MADKPSLMHREEDLLEAARTARERAHAPYSGFAVGATLETADGQLVSGCNIENATFGLTMCAERVAMFKALSEGHREFKRIAIVADGPEPVQPCGACRQILWEFGGDVEVIVGDLKRMHGRYRMSHLLPLAFDRDNLGRAELDKSKGAKDPSG
jgi:cytidine deaminase